MTGEDPFHLAQEVAARHGSQGGATTRDPGPEEHPEGAQIVQLPLWGREQYGAPVSILRSGLFGVVKPGRRRFLEDEKVASWPGTEIRYNGQRLDQADLDVWLQAVQMHQEQAEMGLGSVIDLNVKGFLKQIGRSTGKQQRDWLRSSLIRMMSGAVQIDIGDKEYAGSLIHDYERDKQTGRYTLQLNPKLSRLYAHGWTKLEQAERLALGKAQLAKALHGFVHSHTASPRQPLKISGERLLSLFGEGYTRDRNFHQELRQTLQGLQDRKYIRSWRHDGRNYTILK